jgi:hypothetical protein
MDEATYAPELPSTASTQTVPTNQSSQGPPEQQEDENNPKFVCNVEGCHAKPFGRDAELQRHQKQKHSTLPPQYPCTAIDCNRTGNRAFPRADKRNDHMWAGHDARTLFKCPQIGCSKTLTRDLMAVHNDKFVSNYTRKCPMPRCSFRVLLGWPHHPFKRMDALLVHLQENHDTRGRMNYGALLSERGYDTIMCPICPSQSVHFTKHIAFYHHFLIGHRQVSQSEILPCLDDLRTGGTFRKLLWDFGRHGISADVSQHRQVLLSLCSEFKVVAVWGDIQGCPS